MVAENHQKKLWAPRLQHERSPPSLALDPLEQRLLVGRRQRHIARHEQFPLGTNRITLRVKVNILSLVTVYGVS